MQPPVLGIPEYTGDQRMLLLFVTSATVGIPARPCEGWSVEILPVRSTVWYCHGLDGGSCLRSRHNCWGLDAD